MLQRWALVLSFYEIKINTIHEGWCSFLWRRKRDSNPRAFWANGFQDFLTNPTLPQNNRKYQTIENAENPDVARAFGVLSFPKSETLDDARIFVSKTISKTFLEKYLDKYAPIAPVASHIFPPNPPQRIKLLASLYHKTTESSRERGYILSAVIKIYNKLVEISCATIRKGV